MVAHLGRDPGSGGREVVISLVGMLFHMSDLELIDIND